jgi:hypothetical protein
METIGKTPQQAKAVGATAKSPIIKVSKRTYCALLSFLESSLKPKYIWNNPINMPDGVKYFIKPNKWTLSLYPRFTGSEWISQAAINWPDFIFSEEYIEVEGKRFNKNQQVVITCDEVHNPLPLKLQELLEKIHFYEEAEKND